MIVVLKILRGFYSALAGSGSPSHIAFAFMLGMIVALTPLSPTEPHLYVIAFLLIVTRAGIGLTLTVSLLGKVLLMATGTALIDRFGFFVLEGVPFLHPLWKWCLNLPVIALFGLDRYALMGGLVLGKLIGAIMWLPICGSVRWFRDTLLERISQYRVVKWMQKFWLFKTLVFVFKG